jgi:hypothetical protein
MSAKVSYDRLVFPSIKDDAFRMTLSSKISDTRVPSLDIWLESRSTKSQRSYTVQDISKIGHAIPFEAYVDCLKVGLTSLVANVDFKFSISLDL